MIPRDQPDIPDTQKMPKAMAEGFARHQANWLIVYDNWPLPAIDYTKAASHLMPLLTDMGAFSVFDAIFVHDDSYMCEFRGTPIVRALVKPSINAQSAGLTHR
ncbi:hypothetical protein [Ectopseudomonas oleovorans]|uniref:hypothetical protein n=1 Tax=Ectopseudomonas oleovorans TaxID=301 RepID=UPI0010BEBCD3|nr:hypothetical protein [Pseudomonas oleovorans]